MYQTPMWNLDASKILEAPRRELTAVLTDAGQERRH